MSTHSAEHVTRESRHGLLAHGADILARFARRAQQFICGLHGHDDLLHYERGRLTLQCYSCGYQSPGWELRRAPASEPHAATVRKARVLRMPFAGDRRVA